jgi:hypothetical protein
MNPSWANALSAHIAFPKNGFNFLFAATISIEVRTTERQEIVRKAAWRSGDAGKGLTKIRAFRSSIAAAK